MNIHKSLSFLLVPACAAPFAVNASPLVSIGDDIDIYFQGAASARWESNLFRNETDEHDDLYFTLSPGFDIDFSRGVSNADFFISTRYDIIRYTDESRLDTELFSINAKGSYRTARWDINGGAGFRQQQTNTADDNVSNDLIESERSQANINGEYRISPKFSVSTGLNYSEKSYVTFRDQFADRETITIPVDVFYELTPKVDLSLGYQYRNMNVEETDPSTSGEQRGDYDVDSHFFNVGARGMLLPKVTGNFKVGYRLRDSYDRTDIGPGLVAIDRDIDSNGMLGIDAELKWLTTPKFTTVLRGGRDFGVSGEGSTIEVSKVSVGANYSINQHFVASGNLGYTLREYDNTQNREDETYDLGVRISYRPNKYWSFSSGYTFVENESNLSGASYDNSILDFSASLRY